MTKLRLLQLWEHLALAEPLPRTCECLEITQVRVSQQKVFLTLQLPSMEKVSLEFLPSSDDFLQVEAELATRLEVKTATFLLEWDVLPPRQLWDRLFQRWRLWLAKEIQQNHPQYGVSFAALPLRTEEGKVVFSLPPQGEHLLSSSAVSTIETYVHQKIGFPLRVSRETASLDGVEDLLRQPMEEAVKELQVERKKKVDQQAYEAGRAAASYNFSETERKPGPSESSKRRFQKVEGKIWGPWRADIQVARLDELRPDSGPVTLEGYMVGLEMRPSKNPASMILKFNLQDDRGAVSCVAFPKKEDAERIFEHYKQLGYASIQAEVSYDGQYSKDLQAKLTAMKTATPPPPRKDEAPQKRVELHCHSKMSAQDAVTDPSALVKLAASFGHPAVALTDHGVVQGFPEAYETAKMLRKQGKDIQLILGMEGYLVPDGEPIVYGLHLPRGEQAKAPEDLMHKPLQRFVALDTETTGLDPSKDRVIEIGAVRFERQADQSFAVTERFQAFLNPKVNLPEKITQLTGITQFDLELEGKEPLPTVKEVIDFIGEDPVCAHNALFDIGFLRYEGYRVPEENDPHLKLNPILVDTLPLARCFWKDLPNHKLGTVCKHLGISLENAHRASDDAEACGWILAHVLRNEPHLSLEELNRRSEVLTEEVITSSQTKTNHVILLAKDTLGLYNLYRLVSASHTQYFYRRPRIPKSLLQYFRHGLLVGAACEAGEVFRHVRSVYEQQGKRYEEAKRILCQFPSKKLARSYDYLEIQPLTNNGFLLHRKEQPYTEEDLKNLNRLVVDLAKAAGRPVCATCDSHYLDPKDGVFRHIMLSNIGYEVTEKQPELYFRNTEEMLREFNYFPPEEAYAFCVTNPREIAASIDQNLRPFPDGTFPPIIQSSARDVTDLTWSSAKSLYEKDGEIPKLVRDRVQRELSSIIDNGFAIMYYIAHKLVKKSNDDGYIVGSRGSVGSSLVATFCGITEVNPLPPHYRCPSCRYSQFDETGNYGSGFDLPPMDCPCCGTSMIRDGQDIPFETFLGFNGDKQPDIDLNFSGEYQPRAHRYIQEMFGESHTFRAGTIGSYADKNALALVRNYLEKSQMTTTQAEQQRLADGLVGVKRTTGQHPGGIVVIPKEREVYDFTPIQYPANKLDSVMTTTHFDFNAMHDTILKLDVLGHDDPTMLKFLGDLTGLSVTELPIPDPEVMRLFTSTEPLGISAEESPSGSATLGLPEMGTFMARGMIKETTPTRFYDLVQLMGLSHGTDVWKGNAQDLIRSGTCTINDVIGCRDSIMTNLIYAGLPPKAAFDIMEKVRKGKGLSPEHEALMRENHVPDWYIDSCKKIKYMFPKAHAAAYAISALRIAWFKVHRPEAYYCAYFTVRADEFESTLFCRGLDHLRYEKQRLLTLFNDRNAKEKEKNQYYISEIVEEMYMRGIDFLPVDLMLSHPTRFMPEGEKGIRPPLNAIPGVSTAMAEALARERELAPFKTRTDLLNRSGCGKTGLQALAEEGCLEGMPETAQIGLLEFLA